MLHVTILMVGKTREAFIQEGLAFYQKRLQPFLHLTLKSVREEKEAAGLTAAAVKLREGQRLQAQIPPRAFVDRPHPPRPPIFLGRIRRLAHPAGTGIPPPHLPHRRPSGAGPADPGRRLRAPGPGPPHPDP